VPYHFNRRDASFWVLNQNSRLGRDSLGKTHLRISMQSFKCLSESSGITSEIQVPLSLPPPIIPFLQIGSIHFHPQGCNELGEPFPLLTKELSLYTGWGVSARTSTHLPNSLLPTSVLSKDPGVRAPASKNHLTFHIQSAKPHRIELGHHPHFFGFRHYNSIVAAS